MAECEKPKCFQKFSTTIFQNALKNEIKYQKYVQKSGSLLLNYILTDFGVAKIILAAAKKTMVLSRNTQKILLYTQTS